MLARRRTSPRLISLTPLVDVFLIMLIFFMVTSSFLNLDIIPAVRQADDPALPASAAEGAPGASPALVRLAPDGSAVYRGRALDAAGLAAALDAGSGGLAARQVLVLPSARAPMQALVSLIDALTLAGARSVQVVRIEAVP